MASSPLLMWNMPARPAERRAAGLAAFAALVFLVATAPFARVPLGALPAFYPICQSALIVCDVLTAVLLFGRFATTRAAALALLGAGYVFGALMAVAHALSFPGLFAPAGWLGGAQTTAWLYFLWHAGFPLYIVASVRARDAGTAPARGDAGLARAIAWATLPAATLVLLATAGETLLPPIMFGDVDRPLKFGVAAIVWLLALVPMAMLWPRRPHSTLDLWLMVALCAWCADSALAAVLNHGRYDVGWYAGRAFGLLANALVLGALIIDGLLVHAHLARAHRELQASGEALALANRQLATANEDLERFVGGVAHDLQQPVLTIAGYAQLVDRHVGESLAPAHSAGLKRIVGAAQGAHRMIEGLLQFARLGQAKLELEAVPLERVVDEARTALAAEIERHGVRLQVSRLPTVRGDPMLLALAFVNVLSNAIKYSRERHPPVIVVDAVACDGGGHVVRVRDNGVGFDMAHAQRLFLPFERLHRASEFEGTGMGLANVRRIMERHGGSVRAESAPGEGATLLLEFAA